MFSVPALADWGPMQFTMAAYIVQGIIITLLNIPLTTLLLIRKQNRERKEFVLIACVSLIDIFYVVVNAWNSFARLATPDQTITRADCITQPMYFISLVASQLVANMPLMVALDRFIATRHAVWYYKRQKVYSLLLVAIPIVFSCIVSLINLIIILTTPEGDDKVTAYCFTSILPARSYKLTFHGIKWLCIISAAAVYLLIAFLLRNKTNFVSGTPGYLKRIRTANVVMGLTTINSILFHLIPDFLLVVPVPFLTVTILVQCILFSMILDKIMFNFILFLVFHMLFPSIFFLSFVSLAQSTDCLYYTHKPIGNQCFIFVNEKLNFWDADKYCNHQVQVWSNLAAVENTIESVFLTKNAASEFDMTYGNFWIGVYRPTIYDYFRYLDGRTAFTYFSDVNPSTNFATVDIATAKWKTFPEEQQLPFVCSYYPPTQATSTESTASG
ncbi:unnamed protein product [Caenorhabditis sp. 36 PRJEB53466]|nr:unnamed protein product [Caenorhabditis sp. 36 PRJEB53466]